MMAPHFSRRMVLKAGLLSVVGSGGQKLLSQEVADQSSHLPYLERKQTNWDALTYNPYWIGGADWLEKWGFFEGRINSPTNVEKRPLEADLAAVVQLQRAVDGQVLVATAASQWIWGVKIVGKFRSADSLKPLFDLPNLVMLDLQEVDPRGVYDEALHPIGALASLQRLILDTVRLRPESLRFLSSLKSLRQLSLSNSRVADEHITHIRNLERLEFLHLRRTRVTSKGLINLVNLTRLKHLDLRATQVEPLTGWQSLWQMRHLNDVKLLIPTEDLPNNILSGIPTSGYVGEAQVVTPIPGSAIAPLTCLRQMKLIRLFGVTVTDADLKHASRWSNVTWLSLAGCPVTGKGMSILAQLQTLRFLDLTNTQVDDEGLMKLARLSNLKDILLKGTPVTPTGLDRFQDANPRAIPNADFSQVEPNTTYLYALSSCARCGCPIHEREVVYKHHDQIFCSVSCTRLV